MSIAKKIKQLHNQGKKIECSENDIKALMFLKTKEKPLVLTKYIEICPKSLQPDSINQFLPITGTINFFHMRNRSYFEQVLECLEVFYRYNFSFVDSFKALNNKEYNSYLEFVMIKSNKDFFEIGSKKIISYMGKQDIQKTMKILKELIAKCKLKKNIHYKNGTVKLLEGFYEYFSLLTTYTNTNEKESKIL